MTSSAQRGSAIYTGVSGNAGSPADPADLAWQATRAQTAIATQFVKDRDAYLAEDPKRDIGRQTHANEYELFVSCAPAEALQQQIDHLHPAYIAVHDVATTASRKLLAGVAAAFGRAVQKLTIRRQGYGTALATIEFIELATAAGGTLRMYSTDADTDAASRRAIARLLVAQARLGVVMVGDVPAHAIGTTLQPLRDDLLAGPWPNRQLLLLPLASASQVVNEGVELTRGTGVMVRTTPQVTRPADAWGFIHGTWSRMREQAGTDDAYAPALANFTDAPTRPASAAAAASAARGTPPLSMRPMPTLPRAAAERPEPAEDLLGTYVNRLSELAGMVSCCVFEVATRRALAHAGARPEANDLASHGGDLLAAMAQTSRTLGLGHALPEAAITLGAHHLLLRAVPRHPGLALHAVLDKTHANLTLARLQVSRLDALFGEAVTAAR